VKGAGVDHPACFLGGVAKVHDVSFRFERANCVAVGTFNIYIIQPAWLAKRQIIPSDVQVAIATKMDEPGFRFQPQKLATQWVVAPDRIEISTRQEATDCGLPMSQVLENLPWTPLKAVGCNTVYRSVLDNLAAMAALHDFQPTEPAGFQLAQRTLHVALKSDGHVFNLQLAATTEALELSVNIHTDVTGQGSDAAANAARMFLEHRSQAERLVAEIFGVGVDHADHEPVAESAQNGLP
jgi:hypothetical protein